MRNVMLELIERILAVEDNSKYSLASMEKVKTGSTPSFSTGKKKEGEGQSTKWIIKISSVSDSLTYLKSPEGWGSD